MLVKTSRKTGQKFWGCQKFPACKGTRNTDGDAPKRDYDLPDRDIEGISAETPSERAKRNDRGRWRE